MNSVFQQAVAALISELHALENPEAKPVEKLAGKAGVRIREVNENILEVSQIEGRK